MKRKKKTKRKKRKNEIIKNGNVCMLISVENERRKGKKD